MKHFTKLNLYYFFSSGHVLGSVFWFLANFASTYRKTPYCLLQTSSAINLWGLKVHKIEIFFGFDFEFCNISLLVRSKYILQKKILIGPVFEEVRFFRVVFRLRGMKKNFELGQKIF
jgi:hypothetical protein